MLFCLLSEELKAEGNLAEISILGEPTYKLNNTLEKNGMILGKTYQIDIILSNTGDIKSDEIEVNLTDEEGFSLSRRTYLEAGETKTISFTWSTINIRNQNLRANFYPSNLGTIWNKYNSGSKIFTIKVAGDGVSGTSTQGFELVYLIVALIGILILFKKNN